MTTMVAVDTALAALRMLFAADDVIWVADSVYERAGPLWRVTLVQRDQRGDWRLLRYRYDIPSGTLHFAGNSPAAADRVAELRRSGRLLFADA
jgi:hypothetical protein